MPDQWAVETHQLSHTGQKRRHNEDYVGYFEPDVSDELAANGRLYLVADGVGGAASGEVASQYAVKKILYDFYNIPEPDLRTRLVIAIERANSDIFERNNRQPEHREMATTLVAALLHGAELLVANVGDSRAYLVRNRRIEQISQDHSFVEQLVREGSISRAEAKVHPNRNRLLRSLGIDERIKVDVFKREIVAGDLVVLCSDGLIRHVTDEEIAETVTKYPLKKAVRRLVDLANMRGGKDNISVSATRILPKQFSGGLAAHRQPPALPDWDSLADTAVRLRPERPQSRKLRRWIVFGLVLALICTAIIGAGALLVLGPNFGF